MFSLYPPFSTVRDIFYDLCFDYYGKACSLSHFLCFVTQLCMKIFSMSLYKMYLIITLNLQLLHTPTPSKYNYLLNNTPILFTKTHSYFAKLCDKIYNHAINIHNASCTFTIYNFLPTYISILSSITYNCFTTLRNKIYNHAIHIYSFSYIFIKYIHLPTYNSIVCSITYYYYSKECNEIFTYSINTYNVPCAFITYIIILRQPRACVTNDMYEYIVSFPTSRNRLQLPYSVFVTPKLSSPKSVKYNIRYHK